MDLQGIVNNAFLEYAKYDTHNFMVDDVVLEYRYLLT